MTGDNEDLSARHARLVIMRRSLGTQLARCRHGAGVSQGELARALGRTRSHLSKVEHGVRTMPGPLWQIADEVCRAQGALTAEYGKLAQAEREYHEHRQARYRAARHAAALAELGPVPAAPAASAFPALRGDTGSDGVLAGVSDELAQELMAMTERLVRSVGRRRAMQLASLMLATAGLSGLDADEQTRLAQAVVAPGRVDTHVVNNLAGALAHCRRLEDTLGPCAVLDTVQAQHELVHHLLRTDPGQSVQPLRLLDSSMASAIGNYLINMGNPGAARNWFAHARKAAHDGAHSACAAYAAAHLSYVARLAGDAPAALDAAAAARSLAARINDPPVKALAELHAAGAYALDGHHDACLAAVDRAHNLLTTTSAAVPGSPAYWIGHPNIDSQVSTFFVLLDRPRQAVNAAGAALARFDRTTVTRYAKCEVRLAHALVLAEEIPEAVQVLGSAASQAYLYPQLATELRTTRALLQPWQHTRPVKELDAQLRAHRVPVF